MKRNRDAIAQMAIYDLLCRMQDNIENFYVSSDDNGENICIMDIMNAGMTGVRHRVADGNCQKCIAAWLNEPHEGGSKNA
jgi:hypothetical protein